MMLSKIYTTRVLGLVVLMLMFSIHGYSQNLSDFESALEAEAQSFNSIAVIVFNIIMVLGAIGVVYAYVTKRQDARDYLIYYIIGVVVLGVIRTVVLNG